MSTISFRTAAKVGHSYNQHPDDEHELDHLPPLSAGPAIESMHSTIRQPGRKVRKPRAPHPPSGDSLGTQTMKRAPLGDVSDDPLASSSMTPSWWPIRSKPVYAPLNDEEDLGDLSTRPKSPEQENAHASSSHSHAGQYAIPPRPVYDFPSPEPEASHHHTHTHGQDQAEHSHGSNQRLQPLIPESMNGWIKALTNSIQSLLPSSSSSHAGHSHSHSHSHSHGEHSHGDSHAHTVDLPAIPSASDWRGWNDLCFQPCLGADGKTCTEKYTGAAMSHSHI
jgi:hypothetical protein